MAVGPIDDGWGGMDMLKGGLLVIGGKVLYGFSQSKFTSLSGEIATDSCLASKCC